jgi:DNA-binding HxlR family transcriptional regulator
MADAQLCVRFHQAVELIGRRWTGALIQVLFRGPRRFAELRAAIPDISDRMLSERLQELEDEALVIRSVFPETPVRVEYALTAKGRALEPALAAVGRWAEHWLPDVAASPARPSAAAKTRRHQRARTVRRATRLSRRTTS